jgi:hypothetical protein
MMTLLGRSMVSYSLAPSFVYSSSNLSFTLTTQMGSSWVSFCSVCFRFEGQALGEPDGRGGDGDEDPRLLLLAARPGRRLGVVVTEQAFDDRRVPAQRRVVAGEELQPGEERCRERQVWQVEILATPARAHLDPAARRAALDLAYEARLADTRLAGDQDELRVPGTGVAQALLEPFALSVSIDERADTRRLLPDQPLPPSRSAAGEG